MENSSEKVLVIRKPDRSIHQTSLGNGAAMKAYSNRLPGALQWKFEVMEKEKADKLPAIDPHYVSAAQASSKVLELTKSNQEKDSELETLRKQLAAYQTGTGNGTVAPVASITTPPPAKVDGPIVNLGEPAKDVKAIPISHPAAKPIEGKPGPKKK